MFASETSFTAGLTELPQNCICFLLRPDNLEDIDTLSPWSGGNFNELESGDVVGFEKDTGSS